MRAGSSICTTHLHSGSRNRRYSISWNASRSECPRSTWPMNSTIGVESWAALCRPIAAWQAPGPRVTMTMPGRPVSLP